MLWNLVADVLGRLVDRAREFCFVGGFEVGRELVCVSHLQYADNIMLCSSGEENKVGFFLSLLKIFEFVLRLKVNLNKTSVAGTNMQQNKIQRVVEILGCSTEVFCLGIWGFRSGVT